MKVAWSYCPIQYLHACQEGLQRVGVALDLVHRICCPGKPVQWFCRAGLRFMECCEAPILDVCAGALGAEWPRETALGTKKEENEVKIPGHILPFVFYLHGLLGLPSRCALLIKITVPEKHILYEILELDMVQA